MHDNKYFTFCMNINLYMYIYTNTHITMKVGVLCTNLNLFSDICYCIK